MAWQLTPFALPLIGATGIALALALFAWRNRSAPGAVAVGLQMVGLANWTTFYALELSSVDLPVKLLYAKMRYPGTLLAVMAFVAVCLQYGGRERWITRRNIALASIIPVLTCIFVATNERHRLIWRSVMLDAHGPALETVHGPWFWVHIAYCYTILLIGIVVVARLARTERDRPETVALLVGAIVPWMGNVLELLGLFPAPVDPTPFALLLSGLVMGWSLIELRFLGILPAARDSVIEGMSDGMIVLDSSGRVVDVNPAARAILGPQTTRASTIGRPATDVLAAFPDVVAQYRSVMEGRGDVSVGEGAERRDYDLRISALSDRRGRPAGRVVVFRDVTERTRASQERERLFAAVAEEHGRLQAVVWSSRDGIVFVGTGGVLHIINGPAVRLLHLSGSAADWKGRPMAEAVAAMRQGPAAGVVHAFLPRPDGEAAEGECEARPWTLRWVNAPAGDGPQAGRLVVLHDVTEERAVLRLRDDLTNTMVHDLRNPLTVIGGSLELLEAGHAGSAHGPELLVAARHGTDRMLQLVNGILDVSRLEQRQIPLERRRVLLQELVDRTLEFASPLAAARGLRVEKDGACPSEEAWADPQLLARVLENLVGNAIKFTPQGGRVVITAGVESTAGSMLRVRVRDTGDGVPSDIAQRLFQKFVRGRQKGCGSGLGLAFCRLAVEAHGGRIWVESTPGAGSTFSFTVPMAS